MSDIVQIEVRSNVYNPEGVKKVQVTFSHARDGDHETRDYFPTYSSATRLEQLINHSSRLENWITFLFPTWIYMSYLRKDND